MLVWTIYCRALIVAALSLCTLGLTATAGEFPDVLELDGQNGLSFPPHDALNLIDGNTIEFWLMPDWTENPGYDPVILSNAGPNGPLYLIAMLRNRDGLSLSIESNDYIVPFDFTDGLMHFVAIANLGDSIMVMVDNKMSGDFNAQFSEMPSAGFWIGTADGVQSPFKGAIANLRIWDSVVEPEDLMTFSRRPIHSAVDPHPDLDQLIGQADFANRTFVLHDSSPE